MEAGAQADSRGGGGGANLQGVQVALGGQSAGPNGVQVTLGGQFGGPSGVHMALGGQFEQPSRVQLALGDFQVALGERLGGKPKPTSMTQVKRCKFALDF